jgi:PAS domain-containing protein
MEIAKFSSQLYFALEQATLHLWRFLKQFTERATNATRKMRGLLAGSLDAVVVANAKIAKSSSQILVPLKQGALHLRQSLNPLTERGNAALQKIPEILANFLDAVIVANANIAKSCSQLLVALKETPARLRQTLEPLTKRGKNVLDKTRHLQDARRAKENLLRDLLASSVDAVVVTNIDRRLIAANPIALHLFGVSETNVKQFTIDAFLSEGEILHLDANGLPFVSREETQGECKIRRLTGNLRTADYVFVANFVPFRHLFIFRNIRVSAPKRRAAAAG